MRTKQTQKRNIRLMQLAVAVNLALAAGSVYGVVLDVSGAVTHSSSGPNTIICDGPAPVCNFLPHVSDDNLQSGLGSPTVTLDARAKSRITHFPGRLKIELTLTDTDYRLLTPGNAAIRADVVQPMIVPFQTNGYRARLRLNTTGNYYADLGDDVSLEHWFDYDVGSGWQTLATGSGTPFWTNAGAPGSQTPFAFNSAQRGRIFPSFNSSNPSQGQGQLIARLTHWMSLFETSGNSHYTGIELPNSGHAELTLTPVVDVDDDGVIDLNDIDAISTCIVDGCYADELDLNGDGVVDKNDADAWRADAGAWLLGPGREFPVTDGNLDGYVDLSDLNLWNSHKFSPTPGFSKGDWNYDGVVDTSDLNLWNAHKFTAADLAQPVPEPAGGQLVMLGLLMALSAIRKRC